VNILAYAQFTHMFIMCVLIISYAYGQYKHGLAMSSSLLSGEPELGKNNHETLKWVQDQPCTAFVLDKTSSRKFVKR
jgi:hypothetical protein